MMILSKKLWWIVALFVFSSGIYIHFHYKTHKKNVFATEKPSKLTTIEGRYEQEFLMTRDLKTNTVPREKLLEAYEIAEQLRREKSGDAIPIYWEERGPNNVGGRTRAILIDANDPTNRTVWAGGVSGGLWRTNNIDATPVVWTKINDFFDNLAITSIAQDPTNPNNMYFGTGEWGIYRSGVSGLGIWRSTDGGSTWTSLNSSLILGEINKIEFLANGSMFAATNTGLHQSTDNGNTWTRNIRSGNIQDIEIAINGDVYISIRGRRIEQLRAGTWTRIDNTVDADIPASNLSRIEIAVSPTNANVIYAAYQDASDGSCQAILQSTDGGDEWTLGNVPNLGTICWYAFGMGVDPNDDNRVWLGSVRAFVSGDGGLNWNSVSGGHADYHTFVFIPNSSEEVIIGNDGGVYKSYDGDAVRPSSVDKNNGYNVTQFYSVALGDNNYMLGGTQDNATPKFTSSGLTNTNCVICCCDGGFTSVDQDDNNIQTASRQDGGFSVSNDGGITFNNVVPANKRRLFITPSEYDDDNNILYYSDSTGHMGRVTDVGNTNVVTSDSIILLDGERISALEVSPNQSNRLFIGTGSGKVLRIDNAHSPDMTTAISLTAARRAYISSITVENGNDNHLILSISNFTGESVWESTDGGTNWTGVEGNLPEMPVRWVEFNPFNSDQAIIATELGVWTTTNLNDSDTKWYPTNNFGLANVRVDMLDFRPSDFLLAAATHGRGIFTTDYFSLFGNCPADQVLSGNIFSDLYVAEDFIESDGTIPSDEKVIFQAGNDILLTDGFTVEPNGDFWGLIFPCAVNDGSRPFINRKIPISPTNQSESLNFNFFPNPAKGTVNLKYQIPDNSDVSIKIRNIKGELVLNLVDTFCEKGFHSIQFDVSSLSMGLYLVELQSGREKITEKLIVLD